MRSGIDALIDRIEVALFCGDDRALVEARALSVAADETRLASISATGLRSRCGVGEEDSDGPQGLARWLERAERLYEALDFRMRQKPWLDRGVVAYLDACLSAEHRLIEWSMGRSTSWYARRVASVVAVEHDPKWYAVVARDAPPNCTLMLRGPAPRFDHVRSYVDAPLDLGPFDVAVVDGLYRRRCIALCAQPGFLAPGAIVVVDNSIRLSRDGWGIPRSWTLAYHSSKRPMRST